jgi:hypothetical protein
MGERRGGENKRKSFASVGIISGCGLQAVMNHGRQFELVLFSTNPDWIHRNVAAGVAAIIVDWERNGKVQRQAGADTQIGTDTLEDLERVREATDARVLCRINGFGTETAREIDDAVSAGADEILLPMVTSVDQIERTLELARDRCGVGVLLETNEAIGSAESISRLPITRAYVGLNDLAIARRASSIFTPLVDGTIADVRPHFSMPFGFGGLTLPDRGEPVPCRLLMSMMASNGANFSFLRRSYHRDMSGRDPLVEIPRILAAIESAGRRTDHEIAGDMLELAGLVAA